MQHSTEHHKDLMFCSAVPKFDSHSSCILGWFVSYPVASMEMGKDDPEKVFTKGLAI